MNELDQALQEAEADLNRLTGPVNFVLWKQQNNRRLPATITQGDGETFALIEGGDKPSANFSVIIRKSAFPGGNLPPQRDTFIVHGAEFTIADSKTSPDDPSIEFMLRGLP